MVAVGEPMEETADILRKGLDHRFDGFVQAGQMGPIARGTMLIPHKDEILKLAQLIDDAFHNTPKRHWRKERQSTLLVALPRLLYKRGSQVVK